MRQAKAGGKNVFESPSFYTDRAENNGFKSKVKIYPNGERSGENTHVSVYIFVMKGEYDALLKTSNGILQFLSFDWLTDNGI